MSGKTPSQQGLPCDPEAERILLGSIIMDYEKFPDAASIVSEEDFAIAKHRTIFRRMSGMFERSEAIDRVTVISELMRMGELESCDGMAYLVSLDDGLPQNFDVRRYALIVKEKSKLRQIMIRCQEISLRAQSGFDNSKEILEGAGQLMTDIAGSDLVQSVSSAEQIIAGVDGGIDAFMNPGKYNLGLSTGFSRLDELTGGLQNGDLFVIGARPSMGKTALAMNIAQHIVIRYKRPVLIHSLEMPKEMLLRRMMCSLARVDSQRFRAGYVNQEERRKLSAALGRLMEAPLFIDDRSQVTVMDVRSEASKLIKKNGPLGLVIVDYLQLMSSKARFENRVQEVSAMTRGLKVAAKELGVPLLLLSQLSRAVEQRAGDHRPQLSDLRESGSIEQDADVVGFIFREEIYHRDREDLRGLAELIIAKQRNGPVGTVNLVFLHAQTKFENRAEDTGDTELELQ